MNPDSTDGIGPMMKNKALLIYAHEDMEKNKWFTGRLTELAGKQGTELKLVTPEDIGSGMSGTGNADPESLWEGVSYIINRSRNAEISKLSEKHGIPSFNNSATVLMGNDKLSEYDLFREMGLPVMETVRGDIPEEEIPFDPPFIVKHRRGHGGSRVFKASSHKDALDKMQGTEPSEWIIQRMCDEPGCDMRLYMLGGKVLAGVLRRSFDDFRSNFSLGGRAESVMPDGDICEKACRISERLGADYIGIDLIRHGGGFVFNEIEDAVGARMLYEVSDLDAAALLMDHIYEKTFQIKENGIK